MFRDQNNSARSPEKNSLRSKLARPKQNRRKAKPSSEASSRYVYYLITPLLLLICFVMTFFMLRNYFSQKPLRLLPIKTITVSGQLHYVDQARLKSQLRHLPALYFFDIKPNLISQQLRAQQPWIRSIKVRRVWPATIALDINEYSPLAIWNHLQLLDKDGVPFLTPTKDSPLLQSLPQLAGEKDSEADVWRAYLAYSKILTPLGLKIKAVSLSGDKQWQLQLQGGLIIYVGDKNMLARLNNFSKLYALLLKLYKKNPASFDLRYSNAIAVK